MSKVGSWSTTAGNNNSTPPDGWPEGQAPSTVNDCAREMMAQIRTLINDIAFVDLGMTPTRTGATTFTVTGDQTAFFNYGRRVKAFDATTLYGTVISSSFTTNTGITLRMDTGVGLTTSMTSVAVSVLSGGNNYAIPDHLLQNTDAININGCLEVWQLYDAGVNTTLGLSGSAAGGYVADMWALALNSTASLTATRLLRADSASHVPTIAQCGQLLNSSLVVSVSAADAALAASDHARLAIPIEGVDFRQLAGKPACLSFWVHSNRTGTYCVAFGNHTDRTYVAEYQISAASTWEKKTITIPEIPVTGTWDYSASSGAIIDFTLACGTAYQAAAGAWTSTFALGTSNQTNWLASAGHAFRITGVKLNEGTQAFPLEYRSYEDELNKCKRYFQIFEPGRFLTGWSTTTNTGVFSLPLVPPMRAAPSIAYPALGLLSLASGSGGGVSVSAITTINTITKNHVELIVTGVGTPFTVGQGCGLFATATAGAVIQINANM